MTHGGRAFSKHCIRDSSGFWGSVKGTTNEVNNHAHGCLEKVIMNAVWHNVMVLSQDCYTYEVRNQNGYGARWEFKKDEPIFFRGFVEPPMENGHELKWRH